MHVSCLHVMSRRTSPACPSGDARTAHREGHVARGDPALRVPRSSPRNLRASPTRSASHLSREITDTSIADLVVGGGTGQVTSGAPARGERVAKHDRPTEIAEDDPEPPYGLR